MLPSFTPVDLAGIEVAGNKVSSDEVHSGALADLPFTEDTALLLWASTRPKLNRLGWWV